MLRLNWRGVAFSDLLDRHTSASDRESFERVIFSKMIDWRRDAKRGKISPKDQAAMNEKLATYTRQIKNKL